VRDLSQHSNKENGWIKLSFQIYVGQSQGKDNHNLKEIYMSYTRSKPGHWDTDNTMTRGSSPFWSGASFPIDPTRPYYSSARDYSAQQNNNSPTNEKSSNTGAAKQDTNNKPRKRF
jgi:hypothetical protein